MICDAGGMWRAAHPAHVQPVRVPARMPHQDPLRLDRSSSLSSLNPALLKPQPCLPALLAAENAKIPCVGGHPKNIIMLCCDAFGVLPPVAKLTKEQAMYYFVRWATLMLG